MFGGIKKTLCVSCEREISNNNYKRHVKTCSGPKIIKVRGIDYDPNIGFKRGTREAWNKGLTKEEIPSLARPQLLGKRFGCSLNGHTAATKEKLRQAMLRRRENGYDCTLGRNRHNSEPSWPEQFWSMVIENEFTDKDVVAELQLGRYSLDFAWPHLKKCIEMDGDQHYTNDQQIQSDLRKDQYLKDAGWKVLRIRWKECFKSPKKYIEIAKKFIDNSSLV